MPIVRITNTSVERAKSTGKVLLLWDTDVKGFGVRVSLGGGKSYLIKYRVSGSRRTRRLKIGEHGIFTAPQARKIAIEMLSMARLGKDPASGRVANANTLKTIIKIFISQHIETKLKPRTIKEYVSLINRKVLPKFGAVPVVDISGADVSTMHYKMRDTPRQANHTLSVMSKFFNWCEKNGHTESGSNPCRHIERYKESRRKRFLSQQELSRIGAALRTCDEDGYTDKYAIAVIRSLVFTGARLSEIMTMKHEFIDFDRGVAILPDSKTGEKELYLPAPALEVLRSVLKISGNPYIFCGIKPGKHLTTIRRPWQRVLDLASVDDVRVHDLRHTFASHAVIGGASLQIVGALLGHTQTSTTERYAHLSNDPIRQAGDVIGRQIEATLDSGNAEIIDFAVNRRKRRIF